MRPRLRRSSAAEETFREAGGDSTVSETVQYSMRVPRVKRGPGPKSKMTEATYRKKALPHLLNDFKRHCAYCLDPDEFRHPSLNHVDHFNCKLHGRKRHQYTNLMLACGACNMSKRDKPVRNPLDHEQRL